MFCSRFSGFKYKEPVRRRAIATHNQVTALVYNRREARASPPKYTHELFILVPAKGLEPSREYHYGF